MSQDDEGQISQIVSLGKCLSSKTTVKEAFVAISVKGSLWGNLCKGHLCGEPLEGKLLWPVLNKKSCKSLIMEAFIAISKREFLCGAV